MHETQHVGVKTKAMGRIVSVSIFMVTTNRMSHIGGMNANLVFTPGLEAKLNQRMVDRTFEHMEMGDGVFSAIVYR